MPSVAVQNAKAQGSVIGRSLSFTFLCAGFCIDHINDAA